MSEFKISNLNDTHTHTRHTCFIHRMCDMLNVYINNAHVFTAVTFIHKIKNRCRLTAPAE